MKPTHRAELRKLYDLLKENINPIDHSVIKKLVHSAQTSKTKPAFLEISHYISDSGIANELEKLGYVTRHHEKFHEHTLTTQGLWEYEISRGVVSIEELMSIIHDKYFKPSTKPISDEGKIILASLLFTRIFSKDIQIKLEGDRNSLYNIAWHKILVITMNILQQIKRIKTKPKRKFVSNSNKTYLMVRENDLSSQTHGIYLRQNKPSIHYLDLQNGKGELDQKKLISLFKYIFSEEGFENEYDYGIIKDAIKSFSRQNRFKLFKDTTFMDRSTTRTLIEAFERTYLSVETS